MEERRAPHQEMVREANRYVLGTFQPATIVYARQAILQARELEIPAQEEAVLDFLMSTAGLEGRARQDLRDALMGARPTTPALGAQGAPMPSTGTGAAW